MIGFDLPRKAPMFFQIWFCVAVWYCGVAELVGMKLCNFFIPAQNTCFGKVRTLQFPVAPFDGS